jgi:hypothetical protein
MTQALPPRPAGDVAATWAAIGQLEGYREGVSAINSPLRDLLSDTGHLDGLFMIALSTYRVASSAEVAIALTGIDRAIASLRLGVRQLEEDLRSWQRACERIQTANG